MSVWELYFNIFPRGNKNQLTEDEILSWNNRKATDHVKNVIPKNFTQTKSWSPNLEIYGNNESSRISLLYSQNLEEISCNLDLRNLREELVDDILSFIVEIDGLIYHEGKIIKPEKSELIELIKESRSFRFIKDPNKFLQEIYDKNIRRKINE